MQYQMSGAAAPQVTKAQPVSAPSTQPAHAHPPSGKPWWILGLVVVLGLGALYYMRVVANQNAASKAAVAGIRTAVVTKGPIKRTLRLSGTTSAERFSSMIVPTLRGTRGGFGRDGNRNYNAGNTNSSVQSNGGRSGGGSAGGSASSLDSASAGGSGTIASTAGARSGGSSAFQSSTSRINRTPAPTSRTPASGGAAAGSAASSSSGGDLGSTGGSLVGSGGGGGGGGGAGGGGGDFGLVLQDVVKPGAKVRKGEVVAEFDRQYMMTRVDDYRASLAQTEAAVKKLRAELEVLKKAHQQKIATAKAELDKARLDLKTTPVLGNIESERLKLAAEEAEARYKQYLSEVRFFDIGQAAQLKNAELDLQQSELELKRAEANADRMLVKAPIEGLAVMQNMFRGGEFSQIQQGDQLFPGMRFMQIVDTSSMIINASVNQVDVDKIRIGAKANVRFDAFPGLELPAHVYSIAAITKPGGPRAQFVKEVPVLLKLDVIDPRVIPDLSVSAEVAIAEEQQATIAPLASVQRDGDAPYVFVKKGDKWERRVVELGLSNYTQVAVRQGLQPGEEVALDAPPPSTETSS